MFGDLQGESVRISLEEIVRADPEYLVVPDIPECRKVLGTHDVWKHLSAVRGNRICWIDPDWLHRPGPRIFFALEAIAESLHPSE